MFSSDFIALKHALSVKKKHAEVLQYDAENL